MGYISLPLRIEKGGLARSASPKQAIDDAISLLISTPLYSSVADPEFGFVFTNLRFEQIDEKEGVVCGSASDGFQSVLDDDVYEKKLSGNSRNINTFASDLRNAVLMYEPRLDSVKVNMTYVREERAIHIVVTGIIRETGEEYQLHKIFTIWN